MKNDELPKIHLDRSRRLIHETTDPETFVVEIDLGMELDRVEWDKSVLFISIAYMRARSFCYV